MKMIKSLQRSRRCFRWVSSQRWKDQRVTTSVGHVTCQSTRPTTAKTATEQLSYRQGQWYAPSRSWRWQNRRHVWRSMTSQVPLTRQMNYSDRQIDRQTDTDRLTGRQTGGTDDTALSRTGGSASLASPHKFNFIVIFIDVDYWLHKWMNE